MTPGRASGPELVDVELADGVRACFTTAAAGNLSQHLGPVSAGAPAARAHLEGELGVPVAAARQVHGAQVHVLARPLPALPGDVAEADGLVTRRDDVALAVLVADCVPVLLADPVARVVATAHAGRRGVAADVVGHVLEAMSGLGSRLQDVRGVVGPAACGRCYEVPAGLRDEVAAAVPAAGSTTSWGTPALDLPRAVLTRLGELGVVHVRHLDHCTIEDRTWFSHRGATGGSRPSDAPSQRPAGRFAGLVRLTEPGPVARTSPGP